MKAKTVLTRLSDFHDLVLSVFYYSKPKAKKIVQVEK